GVVARVGEDDRGGGSRGGLVEHGVERARGRAEAEGVARGPEAGGDLIGGGEGGGAVGAGHDGGGGGARLVGPDVADHEVGLPDAGASVVGRKGRGERGGGAG